MDTTVHPRADAETLPDRGKVYSTTKKGVVPGHRVGAAHCPGTILVRPARLERVATHTTPAAVAAEQVRRLALSLAAGILAVIVADSHYPKCIFLTVFTTLPNLCVLMRLACNRMLYGSPPPVSGKSIHR